MHLPSNGATANVVHHDLDLNFQGHEFFIVNISIYQQISQTAIVVAKKIEQIFNPVCGETTQVYLLPKKNAWETHIVSFLANCSTNLIFVYGL